MKIIMVHIPTTFKELRESINNNLKWIVAPKRVSSNRKVLFNLEKEICNELNSGYWDKDITPYMRKELTMGSPNGQISKMIYKAYKGLI